MFRWLDRINATLKFTNSKPRLSPLDARGIPTHECPQCGSNMFRVVVIFEDYQVAMYETTGQCVLCDSLVTVPTEIDRPQELL